MEIESPAALDVHGELGLAQEIIRRFDLKHGLEMTTYSEMPAGAGLGSSSTIATCIIAALDALTGRGMTDHEMAEMARDCETVALGVTYGWQDQYSPVTGGGVKFMKYWPDERGLARRGQPHPHVAGQPRRAGEEHGGVLLGHLPPGQGHSRRGRRGRRAGRGRRSSRRSRA